MGKQKLNPKILLKLKKNFPDRSENSIQARLSQLSREYGIPLNAASELMARANSFSTWSLLNEKEKECFKDKDVQIIKIKNHKGKTKEKLIILVEFETTDKFLKAHLEEINRCYTYSGYTATFILIRKVTENLITEIIKIKFPDKSKEHKELYLDFSNGRIRDLSELIKNLRDKSNGFDPEEKKLVQRILQLSEEFKDDANDKTHSLYHISNKTELDKKDPQRIFDLMEEFFKKYGTTKK